MEMQHKVMALVRTVAFQRAVLDLDKASSAPWRCWRCFEFVFSQPVSERSWSGVEQPAEEAEDWLIMACAGCCSTLGQVFCWLSIPACAQLCCGLQVIAQLS